MLLPSLTFDHLAISCTDLDEGVAWVEERLGLPLLAGGKHPYFGTHNRLLSLGAAEYLEVIAIDPEAPAPGYPRWFGLDRFSGPPRPTNWILSTTDLAGLLDQGNKDLGRAIPLERGDLRWRMAVPESGMLPFDNLHPAVIQWDGQHPAPRLADSGARFQHLVVRHPQAQRLERRLRLADPRITFEVGESALRFEIATSHGVRVLE